MPNAAGAGLAALVTVFTPPSTTTPTGRPGWTGLRGCSNTPTACCWWTAQRPATAHRRVQPAEALEHYLRSARDTDPLLDNVTLGR